MKKPHIIGEAGGRGAGGSLKESITVSVCDTNSLTFDVFFDSHGLPPFRGPREQ